MDILRVDIKGLLLVNDGVEVVLEREVAGILRVENCQ
jgi:hypothetical protein